MENVVIDFYRIFTFGVVVPPFDMTSLIYILFFGFFYLLIYYFVIRRYRK